MVPRGCTTTVDAYLTPVIKTYLSSFSQGFDANFSRIQVSFMQSDGGLTPMSLFSGNKAILSGPAGGVVGYALTSYNWNNRPVSPEDNIAVIGFDMGGTSTDVSRYAGTFEHVFETTTAGVTIQSPQLDINTVAAGGGSRLFYRNGLFVVGPDSAGAHPGPVCYRKGGPLAVTDANVLLGRIQPDLFPKIFGKNENEALDLDGTRRAFEELTKEINRESNSSYSVDEVAYGFVKVANEAMARPIRNLTTMKGYDVTKHILSCFGGAGPQHCCAIAKSLGMKKIYVHRFSGILSAYGLSMADMVAEKQEPFGGASILQSNDRVLEKFSALQKDAVNDLISQGISEDSITITCFLNMRYSGTDTTIMTTTANNSRNLQDFRESFVSNYRREYGFELHNRDILVDDIRVRAVGRSPGGNSTMSLSCGSDGNPCVPFQHVMTYFEGGRVATPVYFADKLSPGDLIKGPSIIVQNVATVVVEPGCLASITCNGDIEINIVEVEDKKLTEDFDPIYVSIFSHRFMGIAEQMGRTLQRTSISVNIKERLDFSCALFDAKGGLVANAPHLPVWHIIS